MRRMEVTFKYLTREEYDALVGFYNMMLGRMPLSDQEGRPQYVWGIPVYVTGAVSPDVLELTVDGKKYTVTLSEPKPEGSK